MRCDFDYPVRYKIKFIIAAAVATSAKLPRIGYTVLLTIYKRELVWCFIGAIFGFYF